MIRFDTGALYQRISSAHKALDYRNFNELANHQIWIPFHFLPGNGGLPAGQDPPGGLMEKLICWPDSPVALDMLSACIAARHREYGLHRLGVTLHIYADTWAHQGFSGVSHEVNKASDIQGPDGQPDQGTIDRLKGYFVNEALPLGHGTVLSNPDKPYLVWSYKNGRGQRVQRDNPRDFLRAAERLCIAVARFVAGDANASVPELPERDRAVIDELFRGLKDPDGNVRHAAWLEAIAAGRFSFGAEELCYVAKGPDSWKARALDTTATYDTGDETFPYRPEFLSSDWKRFHDAVQAHRFELVHEILPHYGICSA